MTTIILRLVAFAVFTIGAWAATTVETGRGGGLLQISIQSAQHQVLVSLPEVVTEGQPYSGSIASQGAFTPEQPNYIEMDGVRFPLSSQAVRIPAARNGLLSVKLLNGKGEVVYTADLPRTMAAANVVERPSICAGNGVLRFPLAGDVADAAVFFDNESAEPLAVSTREVIARCPGVAGGLFSVGVKNGNSQSTYSIRVLQFRAIGQVGQPFFPGELVPVGLKVSGLSQLESPLRIVVRNPLPSKIRFFGDDDVTVTIQPTAVDSSGEVGVYVLGYAIAPGETVPAIGVVYESVGSRSGFVTDDGAAVILEGNSMFLWAGGEGTRFEVPRTAWTEALTNPGLAAAFSSIKEEQSLSFTSQGGDNLVSLNISGVRGYRVFEFRSTGARPGSELNVAIYVDKNNPAKYFLSLTASGKSYGRPLPVN
ncbi:MAG: hypothetical protein HYZ37_16420 [Candidatus Solibacter usitatus]|nr:hypothetical protein [Candidatus Solibacter usitatus]